MKKRVLSLFMALALCLTPLPTAALAEEAGAVQDAANANRTYTTGEGAGLTADSSGEAQDGEADTAVSALQEAHHANHCVCGSNHQEIGDHKSADEKTFTAWNETTSLPSTTGSYYLTQPVSGSWTVPKGVVSLNGHTISGNIKVGSGAR